MTEHETVERHILSHANANGKFAIPLGAALGQDGAEALERLQLREWIRLIDVGPTGAGPGLFRVFMLTAPALAWLRKTSN